MSATALIVLSVIIVIPTISFMTWLFEEMRIYLKENTVLWSGILTAITVAILAVLLLLALLLAGMIWPESLHIPR